MSFQKGTMYNQEYLDIYPACWENNISERTRKEGKRND
jgi:hypothetical protein